jgi:hypothetical protein
MDATIITIIVASLLVVVIAIAIIWHYAKKLIKVTSQVATLFGQAPRARLVSLGLASVLFPEVIRALFHAPLILATDILRDLPRMHAGAWRAYEGCIDAHVTTCFGDAAFNLLEGSGDVLARAIRDALVGFPIWQLLLMLALAALITQGIEMAPGNPPGPAAVPAGPQRKNLLVYLTLGLAAYLCIVAIAAIPVLQERPEQAVQLTVETLKTQLTNLFRPPNLSDLDKYKNADPTKKLSDYLGSSDGCSPAGAPEKADEQAVPARSTPTSPSPQGQSSADGAAPSSSAATGEGANGSRTSAPPSSQGNKNRLCSDVGRQLPDVRTEREQLIQAATAVANSIATEGEAMKSRAAIAFESTAADPRGSWERTEHFRELLSWYQEGLGRFEQQFDRCLSEINAHDLKLIHWSQDWQSAVRLSQSSGSVVQRGILQPEVEAPDCQVASADFDRPPGRPDLGSNLGPFGFLAGWLLRTESLPLALIVGLFGFGLLGAAASTFVREQVGKEGKDKPKDVLISDLFGLIVRGLSAALIVFLAAEGGVAILSGPGGSGEVNAYVLFLTCLIASVFSEVVWRWARRFLHKKLEDGNGSPDDAAVVHGPGDKNRAKTRQGDSSSPPSPAPGT